MIIFGTRGITTTPQRGEFHCPRCGPAAYGLKRVRRFFTLYFIPVLPLDVRGEYVECGSCRSTWDPAVLSYDPRAEQLGFQAQFQVAMRQLMVRMCLADGVVDDEEVAMIRRVFSELAGTDLEEAGLRRDIEAARLSPDTLEGELGRLSGSLNQEGKAMVVRAAVQVAAADGCVDESEWQLIGRVGQSLQMHPRQVRRIFHEHVPQAA